MAKKKAWYLPTANFLDSTDKIIDPEKWQDLHIRLFDKTKCTWVGDIHSSVWRKDGTVFNPTAPDAGVLQDYLYHYARVKQNIQRPYGNIGSSETIEFLYDHPRRKEFEN